MTHGQPTTAERLAIALHICDAAGQPIGTLLPITEQHLADRALLADMAAWRNASRRSFLTQFEATPDSTAEWLRTVILPDSQRVLYLLQDETGQTVGQMGYCGYDGSTAELDNFLRGRSGGSPMLVPQAELAMLGWLFRSLGVDTVTARVLSSNGLVIRLHESLGFVRTRRAFLRKQVDGERTVLVEEESLAEGPGVLFCQYLELTRDRYDAECNE